MPICLPDFPISGALPAIGATLAQSANLVLQAPPGAGKTSLVPLSLLDAPWLKENKIIMLEPRRLAARAAAARMADLLGEEIGQRVGYRIRLDTKISRQTRIEVVTEGILTRMIQEDPALTGVGLVIFDEFHERSLQADLGLALCLESQAAFSESLKILVMSATLDAEPVAKIMGDAPLITTQGQCYPVETHFVPRPDPRRFSDCVVDTIRRAMSDCPVSSDPADILVFLPGAGEIRRVEAALAKIVQGEGEPDRSGDDRSGPRRDQIIITPLYGDLPAAAQDMAIRPDPHGRRKIILSTAIAETSLTIDGVRVVVDCGQMRVSRFDPSSGMTRLVTVPVSRATADQRRGRAGRQAPGLCYRLWSEAEDRALQAFSLPEILEADLAPLALELAQWGAGDGAQMAWLDPPPAANMAQSRQLLQALQALQDDGTLTTHGQAMARLSMHPRLAHMILRSNALGLGELACDLAAILSERDFVKTERGYQDSDIRLRLDALHQTADFAPHSSHSRHIRQHGISLDRGALARVRQSSKDWRRRLRLDAATRPDADGIRSEQSGLVLAFAYPDRVARRRPGGEPRYAMAGGRGAFFQQTEPLAAEDWLVAADLDGNRREARIFLAAPINKSAIEEHFADQITRHDIIQWDRRDECVVARRQRKFLALVLDDQPLPKPDDTAMVAAMVDGIRSMGLACLPWTNDLLRLRHRMDFAARHDPNGGWPDVSDDGLMQTLDVWLAPFLSGITRRSQLDRLDLSAAIRSLLDWSRLSRLDQMVPSHIIVPSGSKIPIDYSGHSPVLAVRLQEMFGCAETPCVAEGKVPVVLHLLSPARRPVQVTSDLASFWANAYRAVKADLKGQYPKHWWPDDPMQCEPTARTKPRRA